MIKRVAIVYLFPGIGDFVCLLPVIAGLQRALPSASVTIVLREQLRRVASLFTLNCDIVWYPELLIEQEYTNLTEPVGEERNVDKRARERMWDRCSGELAAIDCDVAVDMTLKHGVDSRSCIRSVPAHERWGWLACDESVQTAGLTWGARDIRSKADRHWVDFCVEVLQPLNVLGEAWLGFDGRGTGSSRCEHSHGDRVELVCAPGAGLKHRWLPVGLVSTVLREVIAETRMPVRLCGSPVERQYLSSIAEQISGNVTVDTTPDLGVLAEILRSCGLVLANDSGIAHLAYTFRAPIVTVFKDMNPVVWGPFAPYSRASILDARKMGENELVDDIVGSCRQVWSEGALGPRGRCGRCQEWGISS